MDRSALAMGTISDAFQEEKNTLVVVSMLYQNTEYQLYMKRMIGLDQSFPLQL